MGVSTETAAPVDLNAIIEGGASFLARVKELQATKDAVQATFDKLNIGNNAAAALADAQKNQQTALDVVAVAHEEAEKITSDAYAKAATFLHDATVHADKTREDSERTLATFNADLDAARKTLNEWSSQVKKDAEALQKAASAKFAKAEAVLAENEKRSAENASAKASLDVQMKAAKAAEDTFNTKLAAIMAAVS